MTLMKYNRSKKVLFIDPILQKGHVVFNEIYIKSLLQEGVELSFVFTKGFDKCIDIPNIKCVYQIPKILFKYNLGTFGNRLCYLIALILIRLNVKFNTYDKIIFSSFEEISFFFSGIENTYVINHINISKMDSKVKYFFLKKVLQKNTCIVFDNAIKGKLLSQGNFKVIVTPHGLPKPYQETPSNLNEIDPRLEGKKFDHYIFSPSDNSSDSVFLANLLEDETVIDFLKNKNILLTIKGNYTIKHDNIVVINAHLPKEIYSSIFLKSTIILIAYPDTFKNRVSGVLFESFANNKPCVVRDNKMLVSYVDHFCYDPYFLTVQEFIKTVDMIINQKEDSFYQKLKELQPKLVDLF